MKYAIVAIGVGLALGTAPADAQTRSGSRESREQAPQGDAVITVGDRKLTISRRALEAIQELQAAVNAKDTANIPAKVGAAKAVATSPDERYVVGKLQLQAAIASNDEEAQVAAIEDLIATGLAPNQEAVTLHGHLANIHLKANRHQQAAATLQRLIQLDPDNPEITNVLAGVYVQQGRHAEALAVIEKAIATIRASGAAPPESLYARAVAVAYKGKLPQAVQVSREWVKAYPTSTNWKEALAVYQTLVQLDETQTLDFLRLKRAASSLSAGDYFTYGDIAVRKGLSGEAKIVLEEGFAANAIQRTDPSFKQLYALASERTKGDRESLPAAPVASANARQTMIIGDAYYGYGDYAKAAEFYRAALGKPDADANLINLHLGMALARQGDKAGAQAALSAVTGPQAALAEYWQIYAATRA